MWPLRDRRFLFVTGKGGVGKSTVCVAMASALSARGHRVLLASCNAKERVSTMLGSAPVGPDIIQVRDNVWAVNIEPERSLEQYGAMILKIRALHAAVFQSKYVRSFFRAVPGLYDWSMLGKAWYHSTEVEPNGQRRFDVVIFDAPATGHGLDMLRVPKVILDVAPPGILRRDAERAWTMFHDAKETAIVVVTIPEELPTSETIQLADAIRVELGLEIDSLVVNRALDRLFAPDEAKALIGGTTIAAAPPTPPPSAGAAGLPETIGSGETGDFAIAAAARRSVREGTQAESLLRLEQVATRTRIVLPELFEGTPASRVAALAERF